MIDLPQVPQDELALALRAEDLRKQLARYNYHYSVMSSTRSYHAEYDALFDELDAIEKAHPELITPDFTHAARRQ